MPTMTYLQAISDAMREEMRADERVFVMGEDIANFGGAFKVTDGFIEEFGADAIRWYLLASSHPWLPKRFDPVGVREVQRKVFDTLRSSYHFFSLYANLEGWQPSWKDVPVAQRPIMDRWLLSRLAGVTERVTQKPQAGACLHCHGSTTVLYRKVGLEALGEKADDETLAAEATHARQKAGLLTRTFRKSKLSANGPCPTVDVRRTTPRSPALETSPAMRSNANRVDTSAPLSRTALRCEPRIVASTPSRGVRR